MRAGTVFQGFVEAPITFQPSYKYELGVVPRVYSQEKYRPPSFCDRILYRSKPSASITCEAYKAATQIATSDHSPIYAVFNIGTELRYISAFCPVEPEKQLIFNKVYVSGRSGSLITKPKLAFYSNFTSSFQSNSMKIPALVNPSFDDSVLPVLPTYTSNIEFLKKQFIYIALLDRSLGKEVSDSIVGYCILPLSDACGVESHSFVLDLTYKTKTVGKLNGTIRIVAKAKSKK